MAEFEEVAKIAKRMCESIKRCKDCEFYSAEKAYCKIDCLIIGNNIEHSIMDWAEAHPEPVYPSWRDTWQSLFPGADDPCPEQWFGEECPKVMDCYECIKMPMSREVAEKLGIKPITTEKSVPEHDGCEGCRWMDKNEDEEPCKNCCGVMGGSAPDLWEG